MNICRSLLVSASLVVLILSFGASAGAQLTGSDSPDEAPISPVPSAFAHPGIYSSQTELDTIRRRLAANNPDDPMVSGLHTMLKTRFANSDYFPKPDAIVTREDNSPTVVNERDAAMTAYTLALRWAVTGDEKSRSKSIEIMNTWADTFVKHEGKEGKYLDSSWVIPVWCGAAELMRYATVDGKKSGWDGAHIAKFAIMVRYLESLSSTIITQPFNPISNWGTSAMLSDIAAGIYLDDRAMYQRGRDTLLKDMPRIIWKLGFANEITRDSMHGEVGISGAIQAAEACRHQGDVSLYQARYDGQADPRLVVAMRWYADPMRGITSGPLPKMHVAGRDKPEGWTWNAPNSARTSGSWEIALNYYTWISPTPGMEGFRDMVEKNYRPSVQKHSLFILSDSLTHGDLSKPVAVR